MIHQGHVAHPSNADVNQGMIDIARANGVEISAHHLADPNHAGHLAGELQKFLDTKMQQGTPLHGFDSLKGIIEHAGGHVAGPHDVVHAIPSGAGLHAGDGVHVDVATSHVPVSPEVQKAVAKHDVDLRKIILYALSGVAVAGVGANEIRKSWNKGTKKDKAQEAEPGQYDSVGNRIRKPGETVAAAVAVEEVARNQENDEKEAKAPEPESQGQPAEVLTEPVITPEHLPQGEVQGTEKTEQQNSVDAFVGSVRQFRDMVARGEKEMDDGDGAAARGSSERANANLRALAEAAEGFSGETKEEALGAIATLAATAAALRKRIVDAKAADSAEHGSVVAATESTASKDFGIEHWKVPLYRQAVELGVLPKLVDYAELNERQQSALNVFIMFTQEKDSSLEKIYGTETPKVQKQFTTALASLGKGNRKPLQDLCLRILTDAEAAGKLPTAKRMLKEMGKITSRRESTAGVVKAVVAGYKNKAK
jgi:hypothetical protein